MAWSNSGVDQTAPTHNTASRTAFVFIVTRGVVPRLHLLRMHATSSAHDPHPSPPRGKKLYMHLEAAHVGGGGGGAVSIVCGVPLASLAWGLERNSVEAVQCLSHGVCLCPWLV